VTLPDAEHLGKSILESDLLDVAVVAESL
jgi:hypothetical protein